MGRLTITVAFLATIVLTGKASACGGGFGENLEVNPDQSLIIRHKSNEELYVFNPRVCGDRADYGLIMPIPGTLTLDPTLQNQNLFNAFKELSAPEIVYEEVCKSESDDSRNGFMNADGGSSQGEDNSKGVAVIDGGQVGVFDWTLLLANDTEAFTEWLDANGYPYDSNVVDHFYYYVDKSWYFIAFKVSAQETDRTEDVRYCSSLGPIQFAFSTDTPIIPSRIAAAGSGKDQYFQWRLYVIAKTAVTAGATVEHEELFYTGKLTEQQVGEFPTVKEVASVGDHVTTLDIDFSGDTVEEDITLSPREGKQEFRQVINKTRYVDCDEGCSVVAPSGNPRSSTLLGFVINLVLSGR